MGRQEGAVLAHPDDVVAGVFVVGFSGPGEGLHGIDEGPLHFQDLDGDGLQEKALQHQGLHTEAS